MGACNLFNCCIFLAFDSHILAKNYASKIRNAPFPITYATLNCVSSEFRDNSEEFPLWIVSSVSILIAWCGGGGGCCGLNIHAIRKLWLWGRVQLKTCWFRIKPTYCFSPAYVLILPIAKHRQNNRSGWMKNIKIEWSFSLLSALKPDAQAIELLTLSRAWGTLTFEWYWRE